MVGSFFRSALRFPPLRALDTAGGLVLGAAAGLALVWIFGATALLLPGQPTLRRDVQRSEVLRRLNEIVPSDRLLNALARVDPFPSIAGPAIPAGPLDGPIAGDRAVRAAADERRAHPRDRLRTRASPAAAGSPRPASSSPPRTWSPASARRRSCRRRPSERLPAEVVGFDPKNDVAVLRVPGLTAAPLALAEPEDKRPVGIVGYPLNGPLDVEPGRVGRTENVLTDDAYGHGPVERTITSLAGEIRHGNSGGPGDRQRGPRADDRVRLPRRQHRRLRDPRVGRPEGAGPRVRAGVDGRLRALGWPRVAVRVEELTAPRPGPHAGLSGRGHCGPVRAEPDPDLRAHRSDDACGEWVDGAGTARLDVGDRSTAA